EQLGEEREHLCFFVQAEDGIRERNVTGVQTCALPISEKSFENAILVHAASAGSTNCLLHIPALAHEFGIEITGDTFDRLHRNARSEERRVGKECSTRTTRDPYKTKRLDRRRSNNTEHR